MKCGGQCVMTSGIVMMPLWFADNLASQLKVSDLTVITGELHY